MAVRVVLYARVSTQKQAEQDLSIPDQFRQLEDYCSQNQHEIVERFQDPGASATDDNRPGFQDMIAYSIDRGNQVNGVLVLTTSRFFRDAVKSRIYKQRLKRSGVRVIAIHQEVADDPYGSFIEGIFELQDQLESEINGFHTLRGMKENARQGNFNGSHAPFGYKVEALADTGGRIRRKLVPDPVEAELVRLMFRAYVDGVDGQRLGTKKLTEYLNQNGHLSRGERPWTKMRVQERLADTAYVGEYYFNRFDNKSKREKPRDEWIPIPIPPIIDQELFDRATALRRENRPSRRRPPSVAGSKVLLSGLLYCGKCGARIGLETAKGGQYRYYNCSTFTRRGKSACAGHRVPQDELNRAVLEHLSAKLFTAERVREIVKQLATEIGKLRHSNSEKVEALQAKLQDVRLRIKRQYDAIESGALDVTLVADRLRELKAEEEDLAGQLDACHDLRPLPFHLFKEDSLKSIADNLRQAFMSPDGGVAKRYLNLVVKRIEIDGERIHIETNAAAMLAGGLPESKVRTVNQTVLTIGNDWLAKADNCENLLVHTSFPLSPTTPESPPVPQKRRLWASTAVSMAFEFQHLLSSGQVRNQADLARRFDLSRARVTQILAILKLPPPIVDYLSSLFHEEKAKYNERELRRILALPTEEEQVTAFEELRQQVSRQPTTCGSDPDGERGSGTPRPHPQRS